jgi:DNA-binding transcriptional LysR family regulator
LSFCRELTERISITEQQLRNELSVAKGKLKISAPSAFATKRLAKPLRLFQLQHPEIRLEISVDDQQVDLYKHDIDVAIRASVLKDSGLKAKKLLQHHVCFFASAEYINNNGLPLLPQDLSQHSCLTYSLSSPSNLWQVGEETVQVNELIKSDSPAMLVEMALLGSGVAAMPKWMVQNHLVNGQLIELFKNKTPFSLPMYAVYKNTEYLPFKIRALIDYLGQYFAEEEIT